VRHLGAADHRGSYDLFAAQGRGGSSLISTIPSSQFPDSQREVAGSRPGWDLAMGDWDFLLEAACM
jgi:hypothetical protein